MNNNILNHQIEDNNIQDLFNNSINNKFVNHNNNNKNYKYLKFLGNSTSNNLFGKGEIHLVKNNNIKKKILCKMIDLNNVENKTNFKKNLNKELNLYNLIKDNPSGVKYINPCLYKEYLDNMIYLYFNNKIGNTLNNFKNSDKTFIFKLIKKILLGLKSLHNINIPHQNINNDSIILYYKNKNNFQIKFTNFLIKNYKIKRLSKKKNKTNKKNYNISFNEDINYLKKKDIKQLGNVFLNLLNKNNDLGFFSFFINNEQLNEYKNIINTKMLCSISNIDNVNSILKEIIYYDKYGYD